MSAGVLWLVAIGMGIITFGLRAGSLLLAGRLPASPLLRSFLRFVPVAVLSALIVPELLMPGGNLGFNPRLLAGVLAIAVAWRTRSMLPTIATGMVALWVLQAVFH